MGRKAEGGEPLSFANATFDGLFIGSRSGVEILESMLYIY